MHFGWLALLNLLLQEVCVARPDRQRLSALSLLDICSFLVFDLDASVFFIDDLPIVRYLLHSRGHSEGQSARFLRDVRLYAPCVAILD